MATPDASTERTNSGATSGPRPFVAAGRPLLQVVYFIACCAGAGLFMWYAKTTSSTFLEAELASCREKCSPFPAKLEATRQELAHQQRSRRGPAYQSPECQCVR